MEQSVVVGRGPKALIAARKLVGAGYAVTVVPAGGVGKSAESVAWDGFLIDSGRAPFSAERELRNLQIDLMGGDVTLHTPAPASFVRGRLTPGVACPDLSSLPAEDVGPALADLVETVASHGGKIGAPRLEETLSEHLRARYGALTAGLLASMVEKMSMAPAAKLSAVALEALPFSRLKIASNTATQLLRQAPGFESVLQQIAGESAGAGAQSTQSGAQLLYPATGGIGGFTARATARLKSLGVTFKDDDRVASVSRDAVTFENGERVRADLVVWTAGGLALSAALGVAAPPAGALHHASVVLYFFDVAAAAPAQWSWVNVFDPDLRTTRISAPSRFSRGTAPEGRAYICCEVVALKGTPLFERPADFAASIWDEVCAVGYGRGACPKHRTTAIAPIPLTFPTVEYAAAKQRFDAAVADAPGLIRFDEWASNDTHDMSLLDRKIRLLSAA